MARGQLQKNYFSFVGGLNTESSPLNYPDGVSLDESNMDLKRNGSRVRRKGVDFEKGGSIVHAQNHAAGYWDTPTVTHGQSTYEWRSLGGSGSNNALIVQIGKFLHIKSLDVAITSASPAGLSIDTTAIGGAAAKTVIDLSLMAVGAADVTLDTVDISFGRGAAYVFGPNMDPFYIEYHTTAGNFSCHPFILKSRDFQGLDDGLSVNTRPAYANLAALQAGNPEHYYNLRNQGWPDSHITAYITATGNAPSNSDIWFLGKDATGAFSATTMNQLHFGTTAAAKGTRLYNVFSYARSVVLAGLPNVYVAARPTTTTFYSGRLWCAGVRDAELSGTVFFSRVIENVATDSGKCYQDADPTSETFSDLVANDGGTIKIPEAGTIVKLVEMATGIAVFADNGIWHITGGSTTGFSALDYTIQRVTNQGTTAIKSIVNVEGNILYWSRSGLYSLNIDPSSFTLVSKNISQTSIQSKINAVSDAALLEVTGVYDPLEREVKWVYSEDVVTYNHYKSKALTLDLALNSYYAADYAGTAAVGGAPFIIGAFRTSNVAATLPNYESMVRYLVMHPTSATTTDFYIAVAYDDTFVDWKTIDGVGVDAPAYLETAYELYGNADRVKEIDDVHIFSNRTEYLVTNGVLHNPSSCLFRVKWDWADADTSGKWTTQQQAYRFNRSFQLPAGVGVPFDYGTSVIATKHNVRGTGRALVMRFDSEAGKDMQLLGWAITASGVRR